MFTIALYSFTKHENSTKRPAGNGAAFQCQIISPSSIERPRVELAGADVSGYNYAYISEFKHYYWITERSYNNGLWILQLDRDVLASFKTEIGAANLYILRSAAASNGNIKDNYYPITAINTKYHQEQQPVEVGGRETSIPGAYNSGVIVLNTCGTGTAGGSTLWELLPADFAKLITSLYRDINGFQLSDMVSKVVQTFGGNPQSLINSAMWFPFPFDIDAGIEQVKIGSWAATYEDPATSVVTQITGGRITDSVISLPDVIFTLNKHPKAAARGSYLNLAPFTQYTLIVPGCGAIDLDTSKLQGQSSITIKRFMDAFSGQLFVKIYATQSAQILGYLCGKIGIPIQLRGANNGASLIGGAISATSGLIAAIASGGGAAIAGAATAGITTAIDAIKGTPTSSDMGGGFATITDEPIILDTVCHDITDADNTHNGKPLCELRTISTLTGFIKVSAGDVPIPGTQEEQQSIKNYLEGGFYYE